MIIIKFKKEMKLFHFLFLSLIMTSPTLNKQTKNLIYLFIYSFIRIYRKFMFKKKIRRKNIYEVKISLLIIYNIFQKNT